MFRLPLQSTLFPYTTLFRSLDQLRHLPAGVGAAVVLELEPADPVAAEVAGDAVALPVVGQVPAADDLQPAVLRRAGVQAVDRKSTRLNSSHANISYAVFCLK